MTAMTLKVDFLRPWLIWTAGFLSFPLSGIAGGLAVNHVDSTAHALIGGLVTGAVIGAGQSLASSGRLDPRRWVPATAAGMALGLVFGATVVDFGTGRADLALMGALTGIVLGGGQSLALPTKVPGKAIWAVTVAGLWALGWTVTELVGVDVERQYTVFGASGAITVSALAGLLLHVLVPPTSAGAARLGQLEETSSTRSHATSSSAPARSAWP